MTPLASAIMGLRGAAQLARGEADGAALVEPGRQGAIHSFWALAACLPLFGLLRLLDEGAADPPFATGVMTYLVGWLAFAVLSHRMAMALGAGERWFGFIAAWNWCSVLQHGLLAAGSLPAWAGLPGWFAATAALLATGWAIWLEWFATRVTLDIGRVAAAAFVALDLAVAVALYGFSAGNGSAG